MEIENIKAIGDNVLIKPDPLETKTKSGLILVSKEGAKAQRRGKVVSVGEKCDENIKAGDIVYFKIYSGNEIKVNGEEYFVLTNNNVIAKDG